MMEEAIRILCVISIAIGSFFVLTAAIGVIRFRDVYTRLHAVSKAGTFGFAFIVLGAAVMLGATEAITKAILAVLFQFITSPVTGHMLARVALKRGIKPIASPEEGLRTTAVAKAK